MPEYHGSRRRAPALEDTPTVCPQCGSAVRPNQEWCTLCLRVLRPPAAPEPASGPPPQNGLAPAAGLDVGPDVGLDSGVAAGTDTEAREAREARQAQAEAAATLLLAQLASDSANRALPIPPFFRSKGGMAVTAVVGGLVVLGVVLLGMAALGAIVT